MHRRCINPEHLKAKTMRANVLAGKGRAARNAVATHCGAGHELTPENTYVTKRNQRQCKRCQIDNSRANRRMKAAKRPKRAHYKTLLTHCPANHAYSGSNLVERPDGARGCKKCRNRSSRESAARRRAREREQRTG